MSVREALDHIRVREVECAEGGSVRVSGLNHRFSRFLRQRTVRHDRAG